MSYLSGYSGNIWHTIYGALTYYVEQLQIAQTAGDPASTITISEAMLQSLLNATDAITCTDYATAWQYEATQLQAISLLPLSSVPPVDATFFAARLQAYNFAYPAIYVLAPQPPFLTPANTIALGNAIIPDPGLLTFYQGFAYETPPAGLTSVNFASQATAVSGAFTAVATALQVYQGLYPNQLIDVATMEASGTGEIAYIVNSFVSGPVNSDVGGTNAWNQTVTLPAMTTIASAISTAPWSNQAQQSGVIRNAMLNYAHQIAVYLLTIAAPSTATVDVARVRNNDTPMDMAARELGNFELWTQIVDLNGLVPPYFAFAASPGIAAWGSEIILPTPGSAKSAGGSVPSYQGDVLGTDLYIGPINGDMPAWTGDFQTITGYNNLAWALGRRLQTTLNSLIYESTYGSRIPPEVGMVQTAETAGQIAAFGSSALLADPRVLSVLSSTAIRQPNQVISYQGVVKPIGQHTKRVGVNEVISPVRQT